MSSAVPQDVCVKLAELLASKKEETRMFIGAEMNRLVGPMLDPSFNRLETKLTDGLGPRQSGGGGPDGTQVVNSNISLDQSANLILQPSTSSHLNPQFVNMNSYSHQQPNGSITLDSISNQQLSQTQPGTIKEESEPIHTVQHNNHVDEECDCEECVDGGIEVKKEEDDADESSSRPVKRSRMDTTKPNNSQSEAARQSPRQSTDEEGDPMGSEQSEGIDTRATNEESGHSNSMAEQSLAIQPTDGDSSNATEEEIDTESTTDPIQPNVASPNRRLKCPHCPKYCLRPAALAIHLRVHTGDRPFACDLCDKRFSERGNLNKHQLIHQNVKNFRCLECGKHFAQKGNLESHLLTHTGERPFECQHCEMSFAKPDTLKRHVQAKHLHVKSFRCKECGHTGTDRSAVIRHVRVLHLSLPRSIKEQKALNIVHDRDPAEFVERV